MQRCVVAHGLTEDAALVEIGAALAAVPEVAWSAVLARAAASYVDSPDAWRQAALALLVRAGADVERARALKAQPANSFLIR